MQGRIEAAGDTEQVTFDLMARSAAGERGDENGMEAPTLSSPVNGRCRSAASSCVLSLFVKMTARVAGATA